MWRVLHENLLYKAGLSDPAENTCLERGFGGRGGGDHPDCWLLEVQMAVCAQGPLLAGGDSEPARMRGHGDGLAESLPV